MSEELIKFEEITNVLSTAGDVLSKNQTSVQKCNEAGKSLIDTIESCGGLNDELDLKASEFIAKAKLTIKNINERRAPLTQLLTRISKEFTSLESAIDPKTVTSYTYILQEKRNKYAEAKLAEQRKREEEQRKLQQIETEKVNYKTLASEMLTRFYQRWTDEQIIKIQNLFNSMTFETSQTVSDNLKGYLITGPTSSERQFSIASVNDGSIIYLSPEDKITILTKTVEEINSQLELDALRNIGYKKQYFIDLIPSKVKELKELAELEKTNKEAAEKLAAESKLREQKESEQLAAESKLREEQAAEKLAAENQTNQMNSLFDATASSMPTATVDVKVSKKIVINHPAGILEIFQLWWTSEGSKLPIDELEKTFKKQITFCEKQANKDDVLIKSAYVQYVDDVKAK